MGYQSNNNDLWRGLGERGRRVGAAAVESGTPRTVVREDWASFLERVLSEQRDACFALEAMGERQSSLVRQGETDELLRVLSERQAIVDQIAELSDQVAPYRAKWEACLAGTSREVRARLEAIVSEITASIERTNRSDEADRAALETQRDSLSQELSGVSRGRGALSAYRDASGGGASSAGPKFQDRHG